MIGLAAVFRNMELLELKMFMTDTLGDLG